MHLWDLCSESLTSRILQNRYMCTGCDPSSISHELSGAGTVQMYRQCSLSGTNVPCTDLQCQDTVLTQGGRVGN
jgi:hypothetical protein